MVKPPYKPIIIFFFFTPDKKGKHFQTPGKPCGKTNHHHLLKGKEMIPTHQGNYGVYPIKKTLKDFIHLLNEERILIIRAIVGKPDTKNKDDYSPDKRERIFNNQGNYG